MKRLLAVLTVGVLAACSPTQVSLDKGGQRIEVVTQAATVDCRMVSLVTCQIGSNFKSYEENVDNCMNQLRNKAAEKGATHLSVNSPVRDTGGGLSDADCKNCVNMSGEALVCDGASDSATTPSGGGDSTQCYKWQSDYEECLKQEGE